MPLAQEAVCVAPGGGRRQSSQVRKEAWRLYVRLTLPFNVVAAKSFAAASAACDSRIASVVVHASCCDTPSAQLTKSPPTRTYRLLEVLEELVCLLFLRPISRRLHHIVCCQHRLKALLRSIRGHVWSGSGGGWWWGGESSGGRPTKKCGGVMLGRVHALYMCSFGGREVVCTVNGGRVER